MLVSIPNAGLNTNNNKMIIQKWKSKVCTCSKCFRLFDLTFLTQNTWKSSWWRCRKKGQTKIISWGIHMIRCWKESNVAILNQFSFMRNIILFFFCRKIGMNFNEVKWQFLTAFISWFHIFLWVLESLVSQRDKLSLLPFNFSLFGNKRFTKAIWPGPELLFDNFNLQNQLCTMIRSTYQTLGKVIYKYLFA